MSRKPDAAELGAGCFLVAAFVGVPIAVVAVMCATVYQCVRLAVSA